MNDGLIIMLVGMGVVFAFLCVLMAYIKLIGPVLQRMFQGGQAKPNPSSEAKPQEKQDDGEEEAVVAALAVALAGARPARLVVLPGRIQNGCDSDWRLAGRRELMLGPQRVEAGLRGRGMGR
jgi:sodium pump decarboxylase gamma subunit